MTLNLCYKWRIIQPLQLRFSQNFPESICLWNRIKRYLNTNNKVLYKQNQEKLELNHKEVAKNYKDMLKKNVNNPYIFRYYKRYTYIIHNEVVELVLQNISSDLPKEDALIVEINPGFGMLTKALLENGVSQLKVFEDNTVFCPYLLELSNLYPDKLEIINKDFYYMFTSLEDCKSNNNLSEILENVKLRKWNEEPSLKLFLILPTNKGNFLRRMIYSLEREKSIYRSGRVEFFLFISELEYEHMIAKPKDKFLKYRQVSVLYQLLFDIELLGKIKKDCFFTSFESKRKKKISYDDSHLYFVKIIPKEELFSNYMTLDKLSEFLCFVKFYFSLRKTIILPALEQLIPDCGPHFIKYGLAIYTRFGDITPQQMLDIFNIFISLPGYEYGLFKQLLHDECLKKNQDECDIETNVE